MSNAQLLSTNKPLVQTAAQATTSGTFKDFTGIPSWVERITVVFSGVSTNGANAMLVQIGSGTATNITANTGFIATLGNASFGFTGMMTLIQVSPNNWVATGLSTVVTTANIGTQSVGTVTLSGPIDRIRFTTNGGTDTFDAGSVSIIYE